MELPQDPGWGCSVTATELPSGTLLQQQPARDLPTQHCLRDHASGCV